MREILFRGKRLDNGEWVEGYLGQDTLIGNNKTWLGYVIRSVPQKLWDCDWFEVDPSTVGQFTGLWDRNGKRIFEGDIVRLFFIDTEEVGEIVWDEERCRVAYMSPDVEIYGVDGTVEIEIIGNIHDNPELLEVTPDE